MSQPNIATTTFLEDCISKKKTVHEIYEDLGLFSETYDTRKEPVFSKVEAKELHLKIKEFAESFKALYRDSRESLFTDLVADGMFDNEVQELGERYGQKLWGKENWRKVWGGHGAVWDDLKWEREGDRKT